jgi:cell division septation protein DedD
MSEPDIIGPDEAFEEPRQGMGMIAKLLAGTAITVGVVALAGVVWYAYQQGIRSGAEAAAPVITAEEDPVKRRPEEPGGLDVPHQDKLIFTRLAPGQAEEPLERLLPPPEEPGERPEAPAETAAVDAMESAAGEPAPSAETAANTGEPETQPVETASAPPPPPEPPKPLLAVEVPPTPPAPEPPAANPVEETQVAAVVPATPKPAAATDGWRIQLASVSSRERALAEWDRLKGRNTDLLGALSLNVETAQLSRGTFYRIQAGPLDGRAAASALCGQLKSRNQDCLVVAP